MKSPTSSRRRVRGASYLIGALALIFAAYAGATAFEQRASLVHAAYAKDDGYFYRMTAKFEVKETGEKIDFDFVVACNIRVPRWKTGELSDDSTFSPRLMVKATAGGQAVMLKTLEECSGFTSENGNIPADILPMTIWFDNVEDLSNGLGYMSEDAYDNPLSKLRFHGARIDLATRADWEAWRKKAADNYAQRGALPGPWGYDYPGGLSGRNPEVGKYAAWCSGYQRLRLPSVIRDKVRPLWPMEMPRFWAPPDKDDTKVDGLLNDPSVISPPGTGPWAKRFGTPGSGGGSGWSGMPLRSGRWAGKGRMSSRWPTETYPYLWPPLSSAYPVTAIMPSPSVETYVQKLEFRDGALNGFAACQWYQNGIGRQIAEKDPAWERKRHVFMVDDQVVRVLHSGTVYGLRPTFIFERDEYVFIQFGAGL
jgi:hypothetical protein